MGEEDEDEELKSIFLNVFIFWFIFLYLAASLVHLFVFFSKSFSQLFESGKMGFIEKKLMD